MILRGINFKPASNASGIRGFFGEGDEYWYHKPYKLFGLDFSGSTFVAKTTPMYERAGNASMKKNGITPRELFPRCIKVKFWPAAVLNAVDLSSPGAEFLFNTGRWQKRTEPFFLSFAAVGDTAEERIFELREFVKLLGDHLQEFQAPVGLQIDITCPNTGLDLDCLADEAEAGLEIAYILDIPLVYKVSVLTPVETAKRISDNFRCDALCVSNTIPWGQLPEKINWKGLFGSDISPLAEFGGGGLSGKPLLPLVADWVYSAREAGIEKPIEAGGGIFSPDDVNILKYSGASSVFIGCCAILRPWMVRKIIARAHEIF